VSESNLAADTIECLDESLGVGLLSDSSPSVRQVIY